MTLGERIRELRKKHGLSQEQLADKLNVSRQAVQKWESGVNEPNIETIKCIACYFQVDYGYLLNGKAPDPPLKDVKEINNEHIVVNKAKNNTLTIYYILLITSVLIILMCFVWSLIDERSHPTLGEGFYVWYIPFYSSDAELIVFQILNIASIVGIAVSLIKIIKRKEK